MSDSVENRRNKVFNKRKNRVSDRKKLVISFIIVCLISIAAGGLLELAGAFISYSKSGDYRGKQVITYDTVKVSGITYENGVYTVPKAGGSITIRLDGQFINKLQYEYQAKTYFENNITVTAKNVFGEPEKIERIDEGHLGVSRSVVNIKKDVFEFKLQFDNPDEDITISGLILDNSFKPNPIRALFFMVSIFIPIFLIWFRKAYCDHVELAFAIIGLAMGLIMLIAQPPYCTSWDEQIHFMRSYVLAFGEESSLTASYLWDNAIGQPIIGSESLGERVDEIKLLNEKFDVPMQRDYNEQDALPLVKVGYILQVLAMKLGDLLNLPFYFIWLLAKITNLLIYIVLMFFAIRKTPIGKQLLCVLGLAPTAVYLSTVFTYDVVVNAFIILGCTILVKAFMQRGERMPRSEQILLIVCMIIGSCPKAVYVPLLLAGLFLPNTKFRSKKERNIFKGVIIMVFFMMLSTFILPTLMNPSIKDDSRGGSNVSVSEQLKNMLLHPVAYITVLWRSVTKSFVKYDFIHGVEMGGLVSLAYLKNVVQTSFYLVFLCIVFFTDRYQERQEKQLLYRFKAKERVVILTIIAMTVILIWTALYLSFNNVGATSIGGVQGRYYVPFYWLLFITMQTNKVQCTLEKDKYQIITFLIASLFVMQSIYQLIIIPTCL